MGRISHIYYIYVDCNPPGSSVNEDSPGKNTGVGCHALLQGIFPTQGSNPGLPYCIQILYHLSHQGSPRILEWVTYCSPGYLPDRGIIYIYTAKSLQLSLTLWDPIDSSPPGSTIPGILQTRTLECHFLLQCMKVKSESEVAQSSDSERRHGLQPTRLLRPWDSPDKSTGVGCYFLLQGILPTQGMNPGLPHCRQTLYHLSHQGSPYIYYSVTNHHIRVKGWLVRMG